MDDLNVVILAAGMGTRLGKPHPKCLTKLNDGNTILQQQINNVKNVLGKKTKITIVVGFQSEKIIETQPDVNFVYNSEYDVTNTSKSLLKAITASKKKESILWLNGDVVFDEKILNHLKPLIKEQQSFVVVDKSAVGEEEVKYTTNAEGYIAELSKTIPTKYALGEAVGINFVSASHKNSLAYWLNKVDNQDYFEKAIETGIRKGDYNFEPFDISADGYNAIEVDFAEDLRKVLATFK